MTWLMIVFALSALAACGGGGARVAADADTSGNMETADPPQDAPVVDDASQPDAAEEPAAATSDDELIVVADEPEEADDADEEVPLEAPVSGRDRASAYETAAGIVNCSHEDVLARVDFDMRDYYIYRDRVPTLSLDGVQSPERLMEALRVTPDVYSFVSEGDRIEDLRELGLAQGFGFWFQPHAGESGVHFREVLSGSPAQRAGIQRGDRLLGINDRDVNTFNDSSLKSALQADAIEFRIQTGSEAPRDVTLDVAEYRWMTAPPATIIRRGASDLNIGYLSVRRFLSTTANEVDSSLRAFAREGVDELILDLRYNPGGRSDVARRLAGQIGGEAVVGQIYQRLQANDRYPGDSFDMRFEREPHRLNLSRVVVLTSGFSASATEALINGLQPWLDVTVVGERTEGKPFSSYTERYCGKSIDAMSMIRSNAEQQDVIGGIAPDCAVTDQWYFPSDDAVNDALLKAGIRYVETGSCPASKEVGHAPGPMRLTEAVRLPLTWRAMMPEQMRSEDIVSY